MEDRRKARKAAAKKVSERLARLKYMLIAKWLVEEIGATSTCEQSFDFIATYILNAPFGLEEC
jgi:hypothetical protein